MEGRRARNTQHRQRTATTTTTHRPIVCVLVTALLSQRTGSLEYCQFEAFNATCPAGHVVIVENANYGRLQMGRCVTRDYGYLGCSVSVVHILDRFCSGRQSCDYGVPRLRELVQPCPKDLMAYLDASYSCINVIDRSRLRCNSSLTLDRSSPSLYISGASDDLDPQPLTHTALPLAVASFHSCPIHVRALPHQTINVTLHSFGHYPDPDDSSDPSGILRFCSAHLFIVEGNRRHSGPLCPSRMRQRHVYQSHENFIAMYFSDPAKRTAQLTTRWTFILKVEATGCADYPTPAGAWVERVDDQRTIVHCNHTHETWYLTCKDKTWNGIISNCTEVFIVNGQEEKITTDDSRIPFGLVVAVSSGIVLGFIVGFAMLTFVFLHRQRSEGDLKMESICADDDVTSGVRPSTEVPSPPPACVSPYPTRFFLQCHYRADATYGHTVTPYADQGHTSTSFKDHGHSVSPLATDLVPIAGSHYSTDHQVAGSSSCWTQASPEIASSMWRAAVYVDRKDLQLTGGSHVTGESEANAGLETFRTIRPNCSPGGKGRVEPGSADMNTATSDCLKKPDVVLVPRATTDDVTAHRIQSCTNKPEMTQLSRKAHITSFSTASKSESNTKSSNDSSVTSA